GQPILLLQQPQQLFPLTSDLIQLVVGQLAPFLLHFAFELFPASLKSIPVHVNTFLSFRRTEDGSLVTHSSDGCASHPAAFVRTPPAHFCALLAVIVLKLLTFGGASLADFRAHQADLFHKPRAAAHEGGCSPANLGAVVIQADTLLTRIHLAFL